MNSKKMKLDEGPTGSKKQKNDGLTTMADCLYVLDLSDSPSPGKFEMDAMHAQHMLPGYPSALMTIAHQMDHDITPSNLTGRPR